MSATQLERPRPGGFARTRPIDLRRWPEHARRLGAVHELWSARRPTGRLPSFLDLMLPDGAPLDSRLVYGRFLGHEATSFHFDWFGSGLHPLHATRGTAGCRLSDLQCGPYLDLIARDYHDIRQLAVPRFREIQAELPRHGQPSLLLHYIGGVWPTSDNGVTVTGLILVSAPVL